MTILESIAVLFAIVYLVLAIRQNIWCWAAAAISTSLYLVLMFAARLYMESALQVFYLCMAAYGWWCWRHGDRVGDTLQVSSWANAVHLRAVVAVLAATLFSGWLLGRFSDQALPYLDSFTTWGALLATWMVARKVLENWLYWFVIDSVSIYLYISRDLFLTAGLFAGYLVLIVIGYRAWRKTMHTGQLLP